MKTPFTPTNAISARHALVTSALTLALAAVVVSGPVLAQDGTGAATPTPPGACKIVPATATFGDNGAASPTAIASATLDSTAAMTPAASPVVDLTGTPSASPVTRVSATPITEATQPDAEDPLTQDLEATATAVAGCLSDANYDTLVDITGTHYRGQLLGIADELSASDFTALAATLPDVPYQIISVEESTFTDDTHATAVVTYELAHQVRKSTWKFSLQEVRGNDAWVLESETAMEADLPANTSTITVTIANNAYTLEDATVSGPSVVFKGTNSDQVDHEMLVLRLEGDATTKTLLQSPGPSLPKGMTFMGQVTVPAGGTGTLLLSGVQPGDYTIVDLLPNASGLPNLVDGMEATFTVE